MVDVEIRRAEILCLDYSVEYQVPQGENVRLIAILLLMRWLNQMTNLAGVPG